MSVCVYVWVRMCIYIYIYRHNKKFVIFKFKNFNSFLLLSDFVNHQNLNKFEKCFSESKLYKKENKTRKKSKMSNCLF